MNEKNCPICGKSIKSDADIHLFCSLCGMGIPNELSHLVYKNIKGKLLHFCCNHCLSIYKEEIDKNITIKD